MSIMKDMNNEAVNVSSNYYIFTAFHSRVEALEALINPDTRPEHFVIRSVNSRGEEWFWCDQSDLEPDEVDERYQWVREVDENGVAIFDEPTQDLWDIAREERATVCGMRGI